MPSKGTFTVHLTGYMLIAAAACLWGILGPFSKMAFGQGVSPMEVAFWRAVLAAGCFGIHAAVSRSFKMRLADLPMVGVFAVTGVTLFYGSYQLAVAEGGAALAAVLLYTAPAWVTVTARIFFKEALTPAKLGALALTLMGVVGVAWGGGVRLSVAAIGFGLTAGFTYSLYYLFGKYFSKRYSAPNLFVYLLPMGAVGLTPWVEFSHKTPAAWAALLVIALLCTYGAYSCYYHGLKRLEASRASITATLEPVVAGVVAFFWWGERFSPMGYVGSAMIIAAVVLVVFDTRGGGSAAEEKTS